MAKPIWDAAGGNDPLLDTGYQTFVGSPDARVNLHQIPGVDGAFAGLFGVGTRQIVGQGFLEGGGDATASTAIALVKLSLTTLQAFVAADILSYTDTDEVVYTNCILTSVQKTGPAIAHVEGAAGFVARMPVSFSILQLDAS